MRRGSSDIGRRLLVALIASMAWLGLASGSKAQGISPPPDAPAVVPSDATPAPPPPPAAAPSAAVVVPQQAEPPRLEPPRIDSDFDVEKRRWAVGYAGVSLVPTGAGSLTVPAVGLRFWTTPSMGVDFALGIGWTGGSIKDTSGMSTDKNGVYGFLVSGGIPFVLSTHRHVNFEVEPYLTFGYGKTSTGTTAYYSTPTDYSGRRLDVGARAGFEVFFGFIGIPELALSATIGVQFEYLHTDQNMSGLDATDTTLSISTTVQNNPWDIFAGNIAARYYF
jgi:hypothetical protein